MKLSKVIQNKEIEKNEIKEVITNTEIKSEDKPNIVKQWKNYIELIHFKIMIKEQSFKVMKDINKLSEKLENLQNIKRVLAINEHEHIFSISDFNNENNKDFYLFNTKYVNKSFLEKLGFFKCEGYIFYINKAEELHIYKIKNLKYIYDLLEKKEKYVLNNKIGTYQGKPFFLVKYPIPISLDIKIDEEKFFYDAKSFNNYLDYATKGNLTDLKNDSNFSEFIRKNILLIVIILGIVLIMAIPDLRNGIIDFFKGAVQK